MNIQDFFYNEIRKIVFIIVWVIIGLLLGYLKLERVKKFAKWNKKKISKKKQFKIFIKPAVVILGINILFLEIFPLIFPLLKKINL